MTTRELVSEAMQYNHALTVHEDLPERKRRKSSPPSVNVRIQAGLVLIQQRDKQTALQYAMNMQQLARESPGPTASFWNEVVDIIAESRET